MVEAEQEGVLESHGHFTLDPGKALEKLGKSLLSGPDAALLKLCQWAYFFSPSQVEMTFSGGNLVFSFTPSPAQPVPELDLARLVTHPDSQNPWCYFALASNYLVWHRARGLLLLDQSDSGMGRRLDLVGALKVSAQRGTWSLHVHGFQPGTMKALLAGLRARLSLYPVPVTWNGRDLTGAPLPASQGHSLLKVTQVGGFSPKTRLGCLRKYRADSTQIALLCIDQRLAQNLLDGHSSPAGSVYPIQHGLTLDPVPWAPTPAGMVVAVAVEQIDTDLSGCQLREEIFSLPQFTQVRQDIQQLLAEMARDNKLLALLSETPAPLLRRVLHLSLALACLVVFLPFAATLASGILIMTFGWLFVIADILQHPHRPPDWNALAIALLAFLPILIVLVGSWWKTRSAEPPPPEPERSVAQGRLADALERLRLSLN